MQCFLLVTLAVELEPFVMSFSLICNSEIVCYLLNVSVMCDRYCEW